jgi:hypothetical protein
VEAVAVALVAATVVALVMATLAVPLLAATIACGAKSVVVPTTLCHIAGTAMKMGTKRTRIHLLPLLLLRPTPLTPTGTLTPVQPIMSQMISTDLPFARSIKAKIRFKLLVGQVCPFTMLVIPLSVLLFMLYTFTISCMLLKPPNISYLFIALPVTIMCSLNFIPIIFLLRTRPRGSLFFAVNALVACTHCRSMVLQSLQQLSLQRGHRLICGISV